MGTRSMNALMVKAHHKPTPAAAAQFKSVAIAIPVKDIGTAWVWETNIQPLWARTSVLDLLDEVTILQWVLSLPPDDYRMVRTGEELGTRGDWVDHPFGTHEQVQSIIDEHDAEMARLQSEDVGANMAAATEEQRTVLVNALEMLIAQLSSPTSAGHATAPAAADRQVAVAKDMIEGLMSATPKTGAYDTSKRDCLHTRDVDERLSLVT